MVGILPFKNSSESNYSQTFLNCIRKKKNTWWSSDQHYKHTGGKRQTMHTSTDTVLKSVKT